MKNYLLIAFCLMSVITLSQRTTPNERGIKKEERAKIDQLRKTYINAELNLSQEDSIQFWPIYDAFTEEYRALRKEVRNKMRRISTTNQISDTEAKTLLAEVNSLELQIANLKKSSNAALAKIIGYAKTAQLPELERAFKKKLLEELKSRRNNFR